MTEYDEIVIREKLQRLAGHGHDDDVAYASLLRNVRAARRRRAVEMIGGLGAVCVLGVGLISLRAEPERRLVPTGGNVDDVALVESTAAPSTNAVTTTATPTTAAATTTTEPATTTTVPETTTTAAPAPTVPPTQQDGPAQPTGSTTQTTTQTTTRSTTKAATPGNTVPTATTAHAPVVAPSARETKVASYGSITVTLSDGRLSLESKTAVEGATVEVRESGPDKIVVRFAAPTGRSIITARARDGVIVFSIEEKSNGDDQPDVTIDDGDGKANGGAGTETSDGQDHSESDESDESDRWDRWDSGDGSGGSGSSEEPTPAHWAPPASG